MSERFEIIDTALPGVRVLERKPRTDERGWLERMYAELDQPFRTWLHLVRRVHRVLE